MFLCVSTLISAHSNTQVQRSLVRGSCIPWQQRAEQQPCLWGKRERERVGSARGERERGVGSARGERERVHSARGERERGWAVHVVRERGWTVHVVREREGWTYIPARAARLSLTVCHSIQH